MRNDMEKKLAERSRHYDWGGRKEKNRGRNREAQRLGLEQLPKSESMRCNGYFTPEVYLNPLYNFLYSAVGRPWDKVYAEICAGVSTKTPAGRRVIQFIWSVVELNCYKDGGKVCRSNGTELKQPRWSWMTQLYVGEDGILKRAPESRAQVLEKPYDLVLESEHPDFRFDYYRRRRGRWQKAILYASDQTVDRGKACRIIPVSEGRNGRFIIDAAREETEDRSWKGRRNAKPVFDWVYSWRTLSQREVNRLGLNYKDDFFAYSRALVFGAYYLDYDTRRRHGPLTDDEIRALLRERKNQDKVKDAA